jgi:hypothetical protein
MTNDFIAELHDIGKLVDKDKLKKYQLKGHTFEDFDFNTHKINKPTSPSFWGQYHHRAFDQKKNQWVRFDNNNKNHISISNIDINEWTEMPKENRHDVFLLIIADHLASSISRALPQLGSAGKSEGVSKLWNFNFYKNEKSKGKHWAAFTTDDDLKGMFEAFDKVSSPDDFLNAYNEHLLLTPEDKSIPRNITSLYTHIELAGKIFRILRKHIKIETDADGKIWPTFKTEKTNSIYEVEGDKFIYFKDKNQKEYFGNCKGKWQARFIKCHIKFPHSFVRLQDINLLVKRNELITSFMNEYRDYIMFFTHSFISLFLPTGMELKNMFKKFLNNGFFIDCVESIADLGVLRSNLDIKTVEARETDNQQKLAVLNIRNTKVYKKILMPEDVSEEIPPHICDICQMRPATERIKENIREWICDNCYGMRTERDKFNYPEGWQNQKIIWLKFSLNHAKLEKWMQEAFDRYIDSINVLTDKQTLKDEFRSLACHSDFVKDYIDMVKDFWQKCNGLEIMKPIPDYDEIGICKYSGELADKIIGKFIAVNNDYFPDCEGDAHSPVSLSLSISHIKYPVREHWRYFENPKGFLNIRSHNVFEDTYTKEEIKWLMDKLAETERESSHFLYKLIGIYDELNSKINITVEILKNKDRRPSIYNLYSKFETSPEKILNFFRTIEEKDEIA